MRNRRNPLAGWLAAAAAVLALAVAAYWWWSPHLTLRAMQQAANARDAQALGQHVDYPRLRENMKAGIAARMSDKAGAARDNPLAALGLSIGAALAGGMVDMLVRPEVLMRAFETGEIRPAAPAPGTSAPARPDAPPKDERPRWRMEREGTGRAVLYRVKDDGQADREAMAFVLERSGFADWKLTDIRLPAF